MNQNQFRVPGQGAGFTGWQQTAGLPRKPSNLEKEVPGKSSQRATPINTKSEKAP